MARPGWKRTPRLETLPRAYEYPPDFGADFRRRPYAQHRRVGRAVSIAQLAALIRAIEGADGVVEHGYDY
jgi:hypothetical protein